MNKLFVKAQEALSRSGTAGESAKVVDLDFARGFEHLQDLFHLVESCSLDEYGAAFQIFSDHLFTASGEEDAVGQIPGHPTALCQHVCNQFLSHVSVDIGSDSIDALECLSSKTASKRLEGALVGIPMLRNESSLGEADEHSLEHFLRVAHCLSVLSKWSHNRNVIAKIYGINFVLIVTEALRSLGTEVHTSSLRWKGGQEEQSLPDRKELRRSTGLLSAAAALVQVVTRFCSEAGTDVSTAVDSLPSQPWEVRDFLATGMDLFVGVPASKGPRAAKVPTPAYQPSPKNSPSRANSRNSSGGKMLSSDRSDRGEKPPVESAISVVVVVLKALHEFSNVIGTFHPLQNELSDPGMYRGVRSLLLVLEGLHLHAISCMINTHAVLLSRFRESGGIDCLKALLSLSDIRVHESLGGAVGTRDALVLQRSLLVLQCSDACMDAGVKLSRSIVETIADMESVMMSLGTVFTWLSRQADSELNVNSPACVFTDEVMSELLIECQCPQVLHTQLPGTDLYPWDSKITRSTFRANMTAHESACSSLTNSFKSYWSERTKSVPKDGVQVFEPSKSLIYSLCGNNPDHGAANLSARREDSVQAPYFTEILSLPAARMMDHLLSRVYTVVWKYANKSYSLSDKTVFLKVALRMLSEAIEICTQTGNSMTLLIHYILFVARCIHYSPQQAIIVCKSQRVWKLLLRVGAISHQKGSARTAVPFNNKFMTVNSTLAGDVDPETGADLVYHVVWNYNTAASARSESSPRKRVSLARSRNSSSDSVAETPLSDEGFERRQSMDSVGSTGSTHAVSQLDLDGSSEEPSMDLSQHGSQHSRLSGSTPMSAMSDKEEFLRFYAQYVLKDMIMELMRISSHFSFLVIALVDTSIDAHLSLEYEANELTEILCPDTKDNDSIPTDDSCILILRWLNDLVDFHNQISIQSYVWIEAMKKCITLSKRLLDALNKFVTSTAADSGDILQVRPLFWPARAAAVQLMCKIVYSPASLNWIDAFIPAFETRAAPPPSPAAAPDRKASYLVSKFTTRKNAAPEAAPEPSVEPIRPPSRSSWVKHSTISRLILDPLCRDYAISIVAKILQSCAELLHELPHEYDASKITKQSMVEALAHDVVKGLFNTILAAPNQPASNDGVGAVVLCLQALIVLLRNPTALIYGEDITPYPAIVYQRLFLNYGALTPSHVKLEWTGFRYNVFRDLLASLNAAFKRATWDVQQKKQIMSYSLSFMTAVMLGNDAHKEIFWHLLMQKTKRKSSSMLLASSTPHSHSYHDMISMIISSREVGSVAAETILLLMEMLLGGLPMDFRISLFDRDLQNVHIPWEGFFDASEEPTMSNLGTIPLLLNIAYFCAERLQCCILNTLERLIGGSSSSCLTNLSACLQMQPPMFDMVMDVFPNLSPAAQQTSVKLLQVIGRYRVNVAQLKRMFRLLQLKDGKRPKYTWSLLDAIEGMIVTSKVPRHFFFFQGIESGLRVPAFKKWPATKGFSFSTWFCIDSPHVHMYRGESIRDSFSPAKSEKANRYLPRLISFR
ncbi:hypothetical protein B484DRAFT_152695 [Ochromonadaceae sp. CCMP2298]|nr:hypothetical protein B484DRAFT_152695 [Ochromonadaceae sp. CCMP2298]